jgi:hypothetical protein
MRYVYACIRYRSLLLLLLQYDWEISCREFPDHSNLEYDPR